MEMIGTLFAITIFPMSQALPSVPALTAGRGSVRLSSYPKGRVEIFDGTVWGTLCGHYWWDNEKGAENLCKQLGYQTGVKYTAPGGTGPIVAGNRLCAGGEATVYDCPIKKSETSSCTHQIDQGVQCSGAKCLPKFTQLSNGCYHIEESPMSWEAAKAYCTNLGAEMVVVENEEERNEITKMTSEPVSRKARFWLDVQKDGDSWKTHGLSKVPTFTPWGDISMLQKGKCVRTGPKTGWYGWDCESTSLPYGYTLNPMCKTTLPAARSGMVEQLQFSQSWPYDLQKNNQITVLPFLGKEYRLVFELKVNKFGADAHQSVIHLTLGGNAEKYGDRTPGVWIANTRLFCIASAISGNLNSYQDLPTVLEQNKWIRVEISQTLMEGKYMYEIRINGENVYTVENTKATKFEQVKVFSGDNFYNPVEGMIRNLYINSRHG